MVFKVGDEMDFDKKIKDKNLIIYCSNNLEDFAYEFKKYYYKNIKNIKESLDITSSVFVAIYEYLNKNIEIKSIENLIWKIAHNIWNKKAKEYILNKNNDNLDSCDIGNEPNEIDKIIYKEIIDNLENYNLTKKEIDSFTLYYLKDLSIKDIAIKLDSSCSNIKYYLYNARRKIKEKYND